MEKVKIEKYEAPRLSIIVPAYVTSSKGVKDLAILLSKVSKQTINITGLKLEECILIDDGSPLNIDFTKIAGVALVKLSPNQGVARARNKGIEVSEGDYIVFLDADDDIPDDFIAILEDRIREEDRTANKNDITQFKAKHEDGNIAFPEPCAWGKLIKRSWIGDDRFDEDQLIGEEDTLFHKKGKTAVIAHDDRIIYYHRQSANPDSLMKRFWRGEVPRRRNDW